MTTEDVASGLVVTGKCVSPEFVVNGTAEFETEDVPAVV